MNVIYLLTLFFWTTFSFAESFYFSPENKKLGLEYYKKQIYSGCSHLKKVQDPLSPVQMKQLTEQVLKLVSEDFSRAFAENPLVKVALLKDLDALAKDPSCQRMGNHCRTRLLGIPLFYYQRLRPDIPGCQQYVSGKSPESQQCEVELKFRTKDLKTVPKNYGAYGIGTYKDELKVTKNNTTMRLFHNIMYRDKTNLHICEDGSRYRYDLDVNDPGFYYEGLDPEHDPSRVIPEDCKEDMTVLDQRFIPTDFDDRTTVGEDQVGPVKDHVKSFIKSNPEFIVTHIEVVATSAKTPFYIQEGKKKVIDPKGQEKNLRLAQERAAFAKKVLTGLKSSSDFSKIEMNFKATITGPDFNPADLNERFVTRMTPGFVERIEALYRKHEKQYKEKALVTGAHELLDSKKYVNIYQVKFKPFQGFRLSISGFKKENMKCGSQSKDKKSFNRSSKQ